MSFNLPVASFKTTLTSRISSSDTTLTLDSVLDDEGNAISGTKGFVLDEGTSTEEFIVGTVTGSTLTSCLRGVSVVDGITEVSARKFAHRKKTTVKITTHPYLIRIVRALNGTDGFDPAAILKYSSAPTITPGSNQIPDVSYVDGVAIAGAANATTTTKGIVEVATQSEVTAGTAAGGTGASLISTPATTSYTVQNSLWTYAADAGASDAYAITLSPAITAYAAGQSFVFKANTANTGAATLNVSALGAKDVKKYANGVLSDLETNDIIASMVVSVTYDGTRFIMHSNPATGLTSAAAYESQQFFDTTAATGAQATTLVAGPTSDATSLHYHATTRDKGVFGDGGMFISFGKDWAGTGASATITTTRKSVVISPASGTSDDDGRVVGDGRAYGDTTTVSNMSYDAGVEMVAKAVMGAITGNTLVGMFVGFAPTGTTDPSTQVNVTKHIGFYWIHANGGGSTWTLYTSNASGTTQTINTITGYTNPLTTYTYKIVYNLSSILFYIDGVLVQTHSTNMPTGTMTLNENGVYAWSDASGGTARYGDLTVTKQSSYYVASFA